MHTFRPLFPPFVVVFERVISSEIALAFLREALYRFTEVLRT
jgi:hypothetical protein